MGAANPELEPSALYWTVITDFTNDIDLTTHPQGPPKGAPAREIQVISGGVVAVVKPNGIAETTPTLLGGFSLPGQVSSIKSAGHGTTATAVMVFW